MKYLSYFVSIVMFSLLGCLVWVIVRQEDSEAVVQFLINGPMLIFNFVQTLFS